MKSKDKFARRIWMTVVGVCVAGVSVGLFSLSGLGMDPFQILAHGIWRNTPVSFGTCYAVICAIMLVGIFFLNRGKIGLGTIINLFLVGYIADWSENFFGGIITGRDIVTRLLMLFAALAVMCLASAFYFSADLGVSTYDAVALTAAERTPVPFKVCRIVSDLFCVIVGGILCFVSDGSLASDGALFSTAGIGTIITAFFMGPAIAFFREKITDPLLR